MDEFSLFQRERLGEDFGGPIACCYLENDTATVFSAADPEGTNKILAGNFGLAEGAPKTFRCSCCDSRAGHGHITCEEVGGSYGVNTVAAAPLC